MEKISVIVPVFNAQRTLRRCLERLSTLDDPNHEILLVDDASTDGSAELGAAYGAKVVRLPERRGPAVARNIGAEEASGEILAFTDSDCLVESDWLTHIRRHLTVEKNDIVTGGYKALPWQNVIGRLNSYNHDNESFNRFPSVTDTLTGGNFALRKGIHDENPRLEEGVFGRFASAEDTVLGLVLSKKYRIHYFTDMAVGHIGPESLPRFFREFFIRGFSRTVISILFRDRITNSRNISYRYVVGHMAAGLAVTLGPFTVPHGGALALAPLLLLYALFLAHNDLAYVYRREKKIGPPLLAALLLYLRNFFWLAGSSAGLIHYLKSWGTLRQKRAAYLRW